MLASTDLALTSLGQLVILAEDNRLGVADDAAVAAARSEANGALDQLGTRGLAYAPNGPIRGLVDAFTATTGRVVDLSGDDPAAAANLLLGGAVADAEALSVAVTDARDRDAALLANSREASGRIGRVAAFLTAFLLPLGAMLAYRVVLRRQLQLAEVQLEARLEAEREVVRAKNEFIANISHELRTPLTSIYGFSLVLLEQGFIDPQMSEDMVSLINRESAELGRMVEDLLVAAQEATSRVALVRSDVDVAAEVEAVVEPFARLDHPIDVAIEPGTVAADQLRVRQIVRNLVSNAAKHGGDDIRIIGDPDGDEYRLVVEDDGAGVPDEMAERLFSRFVHEGDQALTAGSVGLGLAVAHSLAHAMGGSLRYRRAEGRTSFVLRLPLAAVGELSAALEGAPPAA